MNTAVMKQNRAVSDTWCLICGFRSIPKCMHGDMKARGARHQTLVYLKYMSQACVVLLVLLKVAQS
jgi:hypothetical protein